MLPAAQSTPARLSRIAAAVAFPWQGAALVLTLTAGATLHQHPTLLRGILHTAELAATLVR